MNSTTGGLVAAATEIAGLAHEIRNPLQTIKLNLHILQRVQQRRRELEVSDLQHIVEQSLGEIENLEWLLQRVADLVSPTSPRCRVVNVVEEARAITYSAAASGAQHCADLVVQCPVDEAQVSVDAGRLRRVLHEVLQNAHEAAGDQGRVRLVIARREDAVEIDVEDDGAGVPDTARPAIFEPFFTDKPQHSGLGLALVARYVDQWHGDVHVQTNRWGGATFRVRIPTLPLETESLCHD
jgi:signal transduction histidine kinase